MGKKATGEERPTSVVIRHANGKYDEYKFVEQQLLDFFTCGAAIAWRAATWADLAVERPPHHAEWADVEESEYQAYVPTTPEQLMEERSRLFQVLKNKAKAVVGYQRLQVADVLVRLDPTADIVGVANGGLGYQIIEILLGRYPDMDVRTIGSGSLKEQRQMWDQLLPKKLRTQAEKLRLVAETSVDADDAEADADADDEQPSRAAAKDANAKFDAHRIAYALADAEAKKLFQRCTMRNRAWAAVGIAYRQLEVARKDRVGVEQRFRQSLRAEMRRLVQEVRVPYVTLAVSSNQRLETLLEAYERTLRACATSDAEVQRRMEFFLRAAANINNAREYEQVMEEHLERTLRALPEYTEFLPRVKAMVDPETELPLGKYIGERIFGRWIAGFGSPMAARIQEPMRRSDMERFAQCAAALTDAIATIDRTALPQQPPPGKGKTREWILACERILRERVTAASVDARASLEAQLAQVVAAHDAYRKLQNTKKCTANRPLNRVIAFMGLHVRQGGKYAGTPKHLEFPRRRKGGRANYNEELLRQGAYQWATLIIKGGDSHWKTHVYQPYKARLITGGMPKAHAHRRAFWRMATVMVRWLINEWFAWERARVQVVAPATSAAA